MATGGQEDTSFGSDEAEYIKKPTKMVVAAIDFGTTYSGYAYSLRSEYLKDHLKIFTNENWTADGDGLLTMKTPTTILFDKSGKFDSFGFKAESHYAKLAEKENHQGWKYFRRFKMELFKGKNIKKNMLLKDDQGKTKSALDVFAAAIQFLKDHLMKRLDDRIAGTIQVGDVFWVLTVPAIWDDRAKQFMEEAAKKAGIPENQLTLALEPECAAIFCKELAVKKANEVKQTADLTTFNPGSQFMIADLGGGTVDITAHEVTNNSTLKELIAPDGGPWGGTLVDQAFDELLTRMFTKPIMDKFREECRSDDLDLARICEMKKRAVTNDGDSVVIKPPQALVEIYDEGKADSQKFAMTLKKGDFAQTVTKKRDKLICDTQLFLALFLKSKENVIALLKQLLKKSELQHLNTVLLVGGFSESEIMKEAITTALKPKTVIVPNEAGLAVVKGAVMYGFNADSISSRKMPYTYGISAAVPFDHKIHPLSKKVERYGNEKCEDIFKVFIEKGKEVVPGKTFVEHTFNCPYLGANVITVEIYKSMSENPVFITDQGAGKVGELNLHLFTQSKDELHTIDVRMMFGKTRLEVQAKQHGSRKGAVKAAFDFLT